MAAVDGGWAAFRLPFRWWKEDTQTSEPQGSGFQRAFTGGCVILSKQSLTSFRRVENSGLLPPDGTRDHREGAFYV